MSATSNTLYEFLEQTGAQLRSYDIGRRVSALSREQFLAFEQCRAPYPLPMQRKAWLALVQLPKDAPHNPVIWFLQLDLDEQGLLVQAARDYLLGRLLESARAKTSGEDAQSFLLDNPYAFTPREDRMALFHALLKADLGLPPSRFYAHALDYFRGVPGWEQWEFVGYQGIADVACRHDGQPLSDAVAELPDEPLLALAHCLESTRPGPALTRALIERLHRALSSAPHPAALIAALVRGLAGNAQEAEVGEAFDKLLLHPAATSIEVLAALSGRAWEILLHPPRLRAFLERLAANDHGQAAFEHCTDDLLSLPALREEVRRALRSPELGADARAAFGRMLAERSAPRMD